MNNKILNSLLWQFFHLPLWLADDFTFKHSLVKGSGDVITLLSFALFLLVATIKNKRAKKKIAISHAIDPFWNYDDMVAFSKDMFVQMQNAWSERNMNLVKDKVTEELYQSYQKELDWMKVKKERVCFEDVTIRKTKIIGDEDYKDNEKDTFTAYMYGRYVKYTMFERSGKVFDNPKKKRTRFLVFYYFQRHNE